MWWFPFSTFSHKLLSRDSTIQSRSYNGSVSRMNKNIWQERLDSTHIRGFILYNKKLLSFATNLMNVGYKLLYRSLERKHCDWQSPEGLLEKCDNMIYIAIYTEKIYMSDDAQYLILKCPWIISHCDSISYMRTLTIHYCKTTFSFYQLFWTSHSDTIIVIICTWN